MFYIFNNQLNIVLWFAYVFKLKLIFFKIHFFSEYNHKSHFYKYTKTIIKSWLISFQSILIQFTKKRFKLLVSFNYNIEKVQYYLPLCNKGLFSKLSAIASFSKYFGTAIIVQFRLFYKSENYCSILFLNIVLNL